MLKKKMSLLMALTMALSLVVCSGSALAAENTDTAAEEGVTLSKDPSEYKLFVYWPGPDVFFDTVVMKGIEEIEEEWGVTVDYAVGTEWTQDVENQICEAKAAEGYDLFCVFAADSTGANALYKELKERGCHVVNYSGACVDPQEAECTIMNDNYTQVYEAGLEFCERLGGEGKVIQVLENLGDTNTILRQEAFEAAVAEYPGIEIVQTIGNLTTIDAATEGVMNALLSNQDVNGIFSGAGTASAGMANALADYYGSKADADHLIAAGAADNEIVMNAIKDGVLDFGVKQDGGGFVHLGLEALLYMAEGYTLKDPGCMIYFPYSTLEPDTVDSWNDDAKELRMEMSGQFLNEYFNAPE